MKHFLTVSTLFFLLVQPIFATVTNPSIPTTESYFGFKPGDDRKLITYEQQIGYLEKLAAASDRIALRKEGESPLGKPMYICFISSPDNLSHLDTLRAINRKLALKPDLTETERAAAFKNGRLFLMETLSMHSNEVGPSQAFPIFAYEMATTQDADTLRALEDVVLMVVPCHNPDGMDMVVDWYRKTVNTPYEGSFLPGVYHKYVGHDNNRDFITLTQTDTRVISKIYSTEWFPQVLVEKHGMGASGPRFFVPENHDPIAENIDEGLWNWIKIFGAALSRDMTADNHKGVVSHWAFDNYWPGSTETSLWKNVISFLTENATCRGATPVYVEPTELRGYGKGLSEYEKSVNMPAPWPGGWWRLRDIVNYELSSMHSILETGAENRLAILKLRNDLCRKAVHEGETQPPYAFVLPAIQHDPGELIDLISLLHRHGIRTFQLQSDTIDGDVLYRKGDIVIPLNQPYRAFIKEVMEKQTFPVRHYTPGGAIIRPYDITSWSLPLHKGLSCLTVTSAPDLFNDKLSELTSTPDLNTLTTLAADAKAVVLSANYNDSYRAAFQAMAEEIPVQRVSQSFESAGMNFPAGSFLLMNESASSKKLASLAAGLEITPTVLTKIPTVKMCQLQVPRVALIETWRHDMDAGWTRFVFDQYDIKYTVLHPADLKDADLTSFDVIVFPDADKNILLSGTYKGPSGYMTIDLPPEYKKGMGDEGLMNVTEFLNNGGTILSWRRSTGLFTENLKLKLKSKESKKKKKKDDKPDVELFSLPVRDVSKQATEKGLYIPGSLIRTELVQNNPLTWGMPSETDVFSRGTPVLQTRIPTMDMDRRVIGFYPKKDLLVSGFVQGEDALVWHPSMVWIKKGKGQLVLYTFNPQFRASTSVNYKLIFNAILLPPVE